MITKENTKNDRSFHMKIKSCIVIIDTLRSETCSSLGSFITFWRFQKAAACWSLSRLPVMQRNYDQARVGKLYWMNTLECCVALGNIFDRIFNWYQQSYNNLYYKLNNVCVFVCLWVRLYDRGRLIGGDVEKHGRDRLEPTRGQGGLATAMGVSVKCKFL